LPSIFDSFQKGKTQADDWGSKFEDIRSISNAFKQFFVEKSPDSFVTTKEVHRLSQLIGQMSNSELKSSFLPHIAVSGPQSVGKSVSARQIVRELNKSFGTDYARYYTYNTKYFLDWWEETDFGPTQIVFLDDIYPAWGNLTPESFQQFRERSNYDKIVIISITSRFERQLMKKSRDSSKLEYFDQSPFEFSFKCPSLNEIRNIIKRRTEVLGKPDYFSQDVLNEISIFSLGLPGFALWIARQTISNLETQESGSVISTESVHKTAEYLGFIPALRLLMKFSLRKTQQPDLVNEYLVSPVLSPLKEAINEGSSTLTQYFTNIKDNTKSWEPILKELLLLKHDSKTGNIKRSDLQERTGIKESSLTYQCQNLIKENIITYNKDGREVFYKLLSPMKEALELAFFG